jgi:hypothetical protein
LLVELRHSLSSPKRKRPVISHGPFRNLMLFLN